VLMMTVPLVDSEAELDQLESE
jgi:hypothetical protein